MTDVYEVFRKMVETTVFDRVKKLAESRGKTIVQVEADLNLSKNYLYKWKKSIPNSDKLAQVADYFGVSTDSILGRKEDNPKVVTMFREKTGDMTPDERKEFEESLGDMMDFTRKMIMERRKRHE